MYPLHPAFLNYLLFLGDLRTRVATTASLVGSLHKLWVFIFFPFHLLGLSNQQSIGGLDSSFVLVVCSVQTTKHLTSFYQTQLCIISAYIVFFFFVHFFKSFRTFQTQSSALALRPCLLSLPQLWLQLWTTVLIISLMINPDIRLSARSRYMATRLWPVPVWTWIRDLFHPVQALVIAFGIVLENSLNCQHCINPTTQFCLPQIRTAYLSMKAMD